MTTSTTNTPNTTIEMDSTDIAPSGRIAWFNCAAGVAGDMVLSALVDAGADADAIATAVDALGIDGYALTFERVQRGGVGATWLNLVIDTGDDHGHDHDHGHAGHDHHGHGHHDHDHGHHDHDHDHEHHEHHRPARQVLEMIDRADLPSRAKQRALDTYRVLAEVEGMVHGIDPMDVELHEVGALDSIIDVVATCVALESLDIERIICSPIAVGHGSVMTAHGRLPNPVPAVTHLVTRSGAPVVGLDTTMEVATPTGVALMTTLAEGFGAMPAMRPTATGFGAGSADPPGRPNVVQVVIGEASTTGRTARPGRPAHLIETNVDDLGGEVLAHTVGALLAAGAHDAWVTPIVMKKGRPAHTVSALCDEALVDAVAAVMLDETGTLGLRSSIVERWPQRRRETTVEIDGQTIRVKIADGRVKVEHDDAQTAATQLGLPLRVVLARAEHLAATADE